MGNVKDAGSQRANLTSKRQMNLRTILHESFRALSDGFQALTLERFGVLVASLEPLLATLGRRL